MASAPATSKYDSAANILIHIVFAGTIEELRGGAIPLVMCEAWMPSQAYTDVSTAFTRGIALLLSWQFQSLPALDQLLMA